MAKYPGAFILNEVGTNKELAQIYGVAERTIYRWKNQARAELGAKPKKPTRPRLSTLENFKGTRKELAKKYKVSERTAYRWLAQAREKGAEIPSRQKISVYPGADILVQKGTTKELADRYNVSETTIRRWKRKAITETEKPTETPIESPIDEFIDEEPENEYPFDEPFEEFTDEPIEEVTADTWTDEHTIANLAEISDLLTFGSYGLTDPVLDQDKSLYYTLDPSEQLQYLDSYLRFQYREDEHQFYDEATKTWMYDPDDPTVTNPGYIDNMDIWGSDFEDWLSWQISVRNIKL